MPASDRQHPHITLTIPRQRRTAFLQQDASGRRVAARGFSVRNDGVDDLANACGASSTARMAPPGSAVVVR